MKRILCFLLSAVSLVALMIGAVGCKDSESGECVYEITAEYVPETATLTAMMKVEYKNTTANEISELKFNLYPNAYREDAAYQPVSAVYSSSAYYAGKSYGSMEISSVDGAKNWEIKGEDENILSVSLEESLFPGDKVNLNICFLTKLRRVELRHGFKHCFGYNAFRIIRKAFGRGYNLYAVLFQLVLIECAVVAITAESVEFVNKNKVENSFCTVRNHLKELRSICGFRRFCAVNVAADYCIPISYCEVIYNVNLPFNGLFRLFVA